MSTANYQNENPDKVLNMFDGRIGDLIVKSEYEIKCSCFLSPAEQKRAFDTARKNGAAHRIFFWGGFLGAERRIAVFLPEWLLADDETYGNVFDEDREIFIRKIIQNGEDDGSVSGIVRALDISAGAFGEINHSSCLGAILALGIDRSILGDIVITDTHSAVAFILSSGADFVSQTLSKAGQASVKVSVFSPSADFTVERNFEVISETVMSPRLDGVVRVLCRISREKAEELVTGGEVNVNYETVKKADMLLKKGDVISVRGYGKFIFDGDRGQNRRGRLRIDARKYI